MILWFAGSAAVLVLLWVLHVSKPQVRYASALLALCLLAGKVSGRAVWGDSMRIAAAENGTTLAFAYGRQGAVIGAPASDTEDGLDGSPMKALAKRFPVEAAFSLERCYGFEAELFGRVWFYADRQSARHVTVDIDGLRLVKTFDQDPAAAHLLVNGRNDWIFAPGYEAAVDDRYFSSRVVTLRLPPDP